MKQLLALPLIASVAACGNGGAKYEPVLDGPKNLSFQSDLSACQSLARAQKQVDKKTLGATLVGAGAGAVLGDIGDDSTALGGAVHGAVAGGATAALEAKDLREEIVKNCMLGRGHKVVG
ncbi:MAG: glycine zipper family protein [Pelagimonas sp.]|nr:glycine zipper family protein [Pelagimonas sp.]